MTMSEPGVTASDEVAQLELHKTAAEKQALAPITETIGDGESVRQESEPISPVPRAVAPREVPEGANERHPSLYFNQELSWIDFNWRVLYLAIDERTPLLERVRFVAITASNLDEFIQKRYGGLKRQEAAGVRKLSPDGRSPSEQVSLIRSAASQMHQTMTAIWEQTLKPALAEQANVVICDYDDLNRSQCSALHT
jgi:polyphosphate kinase